MGKIKMQSYPPPIFYVNKLRTARKNLRFLQAIGAPACVITVARDAVRSAQAKVYGNGAPHAN